jgi:SAM-dependent methyltransferase
MLQLDKSAKSYIQTRIHTALSKKRRLQWLIERVGQAERIAHFGCSSGIETLALAWALGVREVAGIDKSEQSIWQARSELVGTQDIIRRMQRRLRYYPKQVPEDDKEWWKTVPDFFKQELVQGSLHLDFVVRDITKPTGLPSDHYDVAFCDFVLHHIWSDQKDENTRRDAQFAIGEMARVARPGGAVAAFELIRYRDESKLDFGPLFEQAGLGLVHVKESKVREPEHRAIVAEFLWRKPIP